MSSLISSNSFALTLFLPLIAQANTATNVGAIGGDEAAGMASGLLGTQPSGQSTTSPQASSAAGSTSQPPADPSDTTTRGADDQTATPPPAGASGGVEATTSTSIGTGPTGAGTETRVETGAEGQAPPDSLLTTTTTTTNETVPAPDDPVKEHPFRRWRPRGFLTEIGVFAGAFWLNRRHELFGGAKDNDLTRWRTYPKILPDIGLRVGLYPAGFIGLEVEGSALPTQARPIPGRSEAHSLIWMGKGSLVLQLPVANLVPFILAGAGALGVYSPDGSGEDVDGTVHFGGGLKYYFSRYASLRVDVRDVVARKRGGDDRLNAHNLELLGGVAFTFGRKDPKPVEKTVVTTVAQAEKPQTDHDNDGIVDDLDRCPTEAETVNNFEDQDGCPESDRDQDGFWDNPAQDSCPNEAGVSPDGCPVRDADNDGVLDTNDKCPQQPETANGYEDQDGCPDEVPKEEIAKFSGAIPGIQFETGSARIAPSSESTLRLTSELLKKYPTLQLEISGHTDSVGPADANQRLSEQRAEAVRIYLVNDGIDASRLTVRGAGETEPVASNKTKAGRAQNRRIEFKIREQ